MNHAWIAALFPLFLSPQSSTSWSQGNDDPAAREKAREAIEKAIEETRKAVRESMRETKKSLEEAHKQLEEALRAAHASGALASGWKTNLFPADFKLAMPAHAFTLGQDGNLCQIDVGKTLESSFQSLKKAKSGCCAKQSPKESEETDEADSADEPEVAEVPDVPDVPGMDDEAEVADEPVMVYEAKAAEEAARAGAEAAEEATQGAEAAEEAAEEAATESARAIAADEAEMTEATRADAAPAQGDSRALEERIAALEHRLGVQRGQHGKHGEAHGSLEERVAALERLAPAIKGWSQDGSVQGWAGAVRPPQPGMPLVVRVPRAPLAPRAAVPATPRTDVAPRAVVTVPPGWFEGKPGALWEKRMVPPPAEPPTGVASAVPAPPEARDMENLRSKLKELKKLGYLGGDRRPSEGADHRREIEERMQKMRSEMDRLREEMTRLREELGQGGGGTR